MGRGGMGLKDGNMGLRERLERHSPWSRISRSRDGGQYCAGEPETGCTCSKIVVGRVYKTCVLILFSGFIYLCISRVSCFSFYLFIYLLIFGLSISASLTVICITFQRFSLEDGRTHGLLICYWMEPHQRAYKLRFMTYKT